MNEEERKHAQVIRCVRLGLRGWLLIFLCYLLWFTTTGLNDVIENAKKPDVYMKTTEEIVALKNDKLGGVARQTSETPIAEDTLQKTITHVSSPWVQLGHTALLLGVLTGAVVVLVWGIVSIIKHED